MFPLAGQGRARLIGTVRGARAERAETLTFADISNNKKICGAYALQGTTYHGILAQATQTQ